MRQSLRVMLWLCSNVAEWTYSYGIEYQVGDQAVMLSSVTPRGFRIVRGGDESVVEGNPSIRPEHRGPAIRFPAPATTVKPGLGFRTVRSARPRFTLE